MNLLKALRLDQEKDLSIISIVGAGGKTTALFQLARQLLELKPRVLVTATSHLGNWQTQFADHHIIVDEKSDIQLPFAGIILITGKIENERTTPIPQGVLYWLHELSKADKIPLLIEADGSRQISLKAPADHEPPIPDFTEMVLHVPGL
ncbi:MAG: selenium cofactor biosynthesis protein YqeC [Chloroflexota bacterium]